MYVDTVVPIHINRLHALLQLSYQMQPFNKGKKKKKEKAKTNVQLAGVYIFRRVKVYI